ncbi:NlpC/P60 family protein [Erysipelotrichaceae bacterium 66-17]
MNFVENNGKKVAAVLCVASCFPVVATVYAMETQPGWHGDKYVNTDSTVAKGWQEIEGKNYYFSEEDGTVDADASQKAAAASVSSNIIGNVKETVTEVSKAAVEEEANKQAQEAAAPVEVAAVETPAAEAEKPAPAVEQMVATEPAQEPVVVETPAEETPVVNEPVVETPAEEAGVADQPAVETPAVNEPVVEVPAEETPAEQAPVIDQPVADAPVVDEPMVDEPVYNEPAADQPAADQPATDEPVYDEPVVDEPVVDAPVVDEPVYEAPAEDPYASLNASIASNAQQLVGVTNGMQCTEVVQQALAMSGVTDAYQLWPDQYIMYGYYTDTPTAGNLIYYDNGGRGVDHIAVYIGDGMAVHGNYNGNTVIASVYDGGTGAPQYIQVQR